MIRFLHTADWQIGKPFGGFEAEKRGVLRDARFTAVERLAAIATDRGCDGVLVAGDVFDDDTVSDRDVQRTLDAMAGFEGPWVLLPGNHDAALAASVWTRLRARGLPANIHVADRAEPIDLADGRLRVFPAPLTRRREGADCTVWFDAAPSPPEAVRVGLAHGALAGKLPEAADASNPIAADRAVTARLDYLALGDWHGFRRMSERTVYAGTPEPDRYPNNDPGYAALVAIDRPGAEPRIEAVATARFAWHRMAVRLDGAVDALESALEAVEQPGRSLIRLSLSGALPLRERVALDAALERWRTRLYDLDVEDAELIDEPDETDLDDIDFSGFVREAVETLRARADDPADPEREAARLALRMAYADQRRAEIAAGDD